MSIVEKIKREAERRGFKEPSEQEKALWCVKSLIREIDDQFVNLDRKYLTLRILGNAHLDDEFAIDQIKKHEEEAVPLREKRLKLVKQMEDLVKEEEQK